MAGTGTPNQQDFAIIGLEVYRISLETSSWFSGRRVCSDPSFFFFFFPWIQDLRVLERSNRLFSPPPRIDSIPEKAGLDFQADILNTTSS